VSESTTDTYTVSAKTGEHYGAALVVVRGDTAQELAENLGMVTEQSVVDAIVSFEAALVAARGLNAPAPAPAQQQSQQTSTPSNVVDGPQDKFCNHGKRDFKSGTNSRGAWKGWMCPQPKNAADKCEPIWG
jgi:hypothetical protein